MSKQQYARQMESGVRDRAGCCLTLFFLLLLLFTAVPAVSANIYVSHGLFGEVTSQTVLEEKHNEIADIKCQVQRRTEKQKGINIFNIWFLVWISIICIIFLAHIYKRPREDTIVDQWIRMND